MYQEAIDGFTREIQSELFRRLNITDLPLDLHGFENFVFAAGDRVVRVSHGSHRSISQLSGELEYVHRLAEQGAPVARPIPLSHGGFVESLDGYHACLFERALGERVEIPVQDAVIRAWGEAVGLFHRISIGFHTDHSRPDWRSDENHNFVARIPSSQTRILERASDLMQRLALLPCDESVYGMIHSDAHPGNFLVQDDQLTFFDFDDCLYAWFGYDLATILFGVTVHTEERKRNESLPAFLDLFLQGYEKSYEADKLLFAHMPEFILLREFSFYGVVHAFMDLDNLEYETARNYMQGRQALLEQGAPLIDMDFSAYC